MANQHSRNLVFSSETAERNSTKLDKEAITQRFLISLGYFGPMAALDSDWLRHLHVRLLTKFDRKDNLNVLYQIFVFRIDQEDNMTARDIPSAKVANCTQVHDMRPLWSFVFLF